MTEHGLAAVAAAPPSIVTSLTVLGVSLPVWIQIATLVYLLLIIVPQLPKAWRTVRNVFRSNDESKR